MKLVKNDENYYATVVALPETYELKKCDNVVGTKIFGSQIIVSKQTKVGQLGLFFPVGCGLSTEFMRNNNLHREKELNLDGEKTGFFEKNGRVRAQLFRGNESDGFWIPIESLTFTGIPLKEFKEGQTFNELNGVTIVTKYVIPERQKGGPNGEKTADTTAEDLGILAGQFELHGKTKHIAQNLGLLTKEDRVSVTIKKHGTSAVAGKPLCKNKLTWYQKILQFFRLKSYPDKVYKLVAASRSKIKDTNRKSTRFDLWVDNAKRIEPLIQNGYVLYGEIVGAFPTGKLIQKGYDYGYTDDYEFFIYKIVNNNENKRSLTYAEIVAYCDLMNFEADLLKYNCRKLVPIELVKQGTIEYLALNTPTLNRITDENVFQIVFDRLKSEVEIMEPLCKNKVPREGYVIRIENPEEMKNRPAYKLKSFLFKKFEDEQVEPNIEDEA